jgi:transposase
MCEIEGNVEKRLTVKFNTVIHDRVHKEVCQLKDQISTEVNELKEKVMSSMFSNGLGAITVCTKSLAPN